MAKTTIEFSEDAVKELEKLAEGSHSSKADVIRRALALYGYLLNQLGPTKELGIVEDNTVKKIIAVPGINA